MKKSPFLRFVVIATAVVAVFCCFVQHDNLIAWIRAAHTVSRQRHEIERYKTDIEALDERIEAMSTDRDTLEKYAREHFYFAEPGDDVYIIGD